MTWQENAENVRVVAGGEASELAYLTQQDRTPQEKHTDHALEQASEAGLASVAAVTESLEWMATMTEIPAKFRGLPVTLGQWVEWVNEQKRLRR
jgi:hypothetical protein